LPDYPEPVVRRAACGDGAPCAFFTSGFVSEPCVLFLYPGTVSGDRSRQSRA
jgi:hypothetical protein